MRRQQCGASFFSTMMILMVIGIFAAVGLKLYPVYFDHYLINSTVVDLTENQSDIAKSNREIRIILSKRFRVNQVKLPSEEALKLERDAGVLTITLNYQVEVPMFYNVAALVKFDEKYEVIPR